MSYTKTVMGAGTSAVQAAAIVGGVNATISAAGTTQGTATVLYPLGLHTVTTVTAATGVILAIGALGDETVIFNGGANTLLVYPPVGAKINNLTTNTGINLAVNTAILLKCAYATQWIGILSA